ncbi:FAD-linked sulfhydryl oxidase ALR-like [Diaphorina citri]|uniref:Sulfhydryl oxidase n=1 Tax=Diaphorina citri TaxID=121845 RepID=A0A1S3DJ60_DIACI|nr:FAD-linked sulfhydryl oxidase ALR-like [Diaphorina citri]KAI5721458.1 hypothetical protein M8J77_021018 [Diaphorina citri]
MPSRYSYESSEGDPHSGSPNPFASFANASSTNTNKTQEGEKKPCRACMDFKTWRKQQAKSSKQTGSASGVDSTQQHSPSNCPLDKDQLGQHTWGFLHTVAAYYPDKPSSDQQKDMSTFFTLLSKFYPCEVCATDLAEQLKVRPPATSSQSSLSQWLCWLHNGVNEKLGKPLFDCTKVNERWRDGWSDGSCDY